MFLNDWSYASLINEVVTFHGNLQCAPDDVLRLLVQDRRSRYAVLPEHDLETVVKLAHCSCQRQAWPTSENPAVLLEKWRTVLTPRQWVAILDAARKKNYGRLKELIAEQFPSP